MLILCLSFVSPIKVTAAERQNDNYTNLQFDKPEYNIQPLTDGYYYWKVEKKENLGTSYGAWRLGPQGSGPATLCLNKTDTVSNTISGSYTSVIAISASLGVSIGKSQSHSAQYSVLVPKNKIYQIKYRPLFTTYKVVQKQYYKIDGYSTPTNNTKTCYVNVFYDWGFSYSEI